MSKQTVKRPALRVVPLTMRVIYDPAKSKHPATWNWIALAGFGDGASDLVGFKEGKERPATKAETLEFVAGILGVSSDEVTFE